MGMTVSACYIFLAIVLAPALVQVGLDPMASHLFILLLGHALLYHAARCAPPQWPPRGISWGRERCARR